MSFAVETDYRRWKQPVFEHDLDGFLAQRRLRSGLHLIAYGAVELALLVVNRKAKATFYGFHAAQSPVTRRPVPYFQGRGVAPRRLNTVLVCDPSLYLDESVRVGWHLGNRHIAMLDDLPRIMDRIDALSSASGPRLLWGNSAGGTAALRYARDEDTSVVMNPQIILERFTRGRIMPWLEHGWGITDKAEQRAFVGAIGDLTRTPPKGRIVYCQNEHDDHVEEHLKPLADALGVSTEPGDNGRFRLILGDWGKGHIPPPSAVQAGFVAEEVERMLGPERAWRRWLRR